MEDQERTEEQEDVEGHARRKSVAANEEPTDELAESDDVEGHLKNKRSVN